VTLFAPDSALVGQVKPSPNHGMRSTPRPDMIVLHYTGLADAPAALRLLCSPRSELSAHYVVLEDGRVVQCVAEARRAWHAGVSAWADETDINSCSIGIEVVNPGHELGYPDFPGRQVEGVIALCRDIISRHAIRPDRILAHSDIAPARKKDPGEKFPWHRLHSCGIGLWVDPAPVGDDGGSLKPGDEGEAVAQLQSALADYGYGIAPSGHFDRSTAEVVGAFQRHFRPARVDGVADQSTVKTLEALLARRSVLNVR
jgi:N-acetylmuramoyl-L-alanine amidase